MIVAWSVRRTTESIRHYLDSHRQYREGWLADSQHTGPCGEIDPLRPLIRVHAKKSTFQSKQTQTFFSASRPAQLSRRQMAATADGDLHMQRQCHRRARCLTLACHVLRRSAVIRSKLSLRGPESVSATCFPPQKTEDCSAYIGIRRKYPSDQAKASSVFNFPPGPRKNPTSRESSWTRATQTENVGLRLSISACLSNPKIGCARAVNATLVQLPALDPD